MENPRNITDLPLEILDQIFGYLSYLSSKVKLAQTHEKLGKAFVCHSRNEFRRLSPDANLTPEQWVFVIKECGATVEELFYNEKCPGLYWDDLIAQAVVKHCPNLTSVSTCVYRSQHDSVQEFLIKTKNSLISLSLKLIEHFTHCSLMNVVGEMTQLKKLSIIGFVDEQVNQVQKLISLETLKIEELYYRTRQELDILQICSSLKNLRKLKSEVTSELPDCPKLKYLDIRNLTCHIEGYILKFIKKNGANIHTICEKCYPLITADGFLQLLRSCPKLRVLYTQLEYIKLYLTYVTNMVEILRENRVTPEDPLELVVCSRIKWKWIKRLLLRTPNSELIDLYMGTL
ncbi:uncharacterized protein LOC128257324 isoform X2 [Drosophila gunungcola]|uniref:F-box domain-containing protein n=1 Tax=Drosophila gunungcola TaxID=103775 RepID=A0A9P9YR39_9MUSC|nr:uncharacterized protein LOC128257324 isoform X2 [Drosophila gunungcola]KAI8041604.1 hypothetical protein M5D96_005869 [Drosophila gunungcola]